MGRVVLNHSTHINGLIKILKKLSKNEKIKSITPAVISNGKKARPRLELRVTRKVLGGYKLIARKGSMAQVVYIIASLDKPELEELIANNIND
ncbi:MULTISPECIES: DUF2103 domain-containing protein [Prochlorococcus]|uniref:DUF2103 domain-containing protein n=1 Tax=Prochlorococcus TaxID=1218 RepID=UPI000533A7EA|nr:MULTISPECIES: DUF2103 domain-containing protein [Prochlorococcus]KGG12502.1 hypothetical protein EV05_1714 [Prochlorococcus sp. MIT 0601]